MGRRDPDVIVVGASLACAKHLHDHHVSVQIIEASDAVGGRVRTDTVEGFLLDRASRSFSPLTRRRGRF